MDAVPETSGSLAAALAAFQGEVPTVPKNKTANVGTYSYKYADLADVAAAAYPLLSKHGLAFTCCPAHGTNGQELVASLLHSSGERMTGALPISGRTPQELGSSISYARRYLLGAMTGVVTDADDDGALASAEPKQQRQSRPNAKPAAKPQPKVEPADTGELMTQRTRGQMFALFAEQHIAEADQKAGIAGVIGHPVESRADLTEAQGLAVIAALRARTKSQPAVEDDGPNVGSAA